MADVAIACLDQDADGAGSCAAVARKLARQLALPCLGSADSLENVGFLLGVSDKGLSLGMNRQDSPGIVRVDFENSKLEYRVQSRVTRQAICRAVGVKPGLYPTVLDATAGLGKDAFVLASTGCHVHMLERNPVVFALLNDGLRRARESQNEGVRQTVQRLSVTHVALNGFSCPEPGFEVVYLDPMFPARRKTARVKKDMYVLQQFLARIGETTDEATLLGQALTIARRRVVMKRPLHAPDVADRPPTFRLTGRSNRFDVYVTG